MPQQRCRFMNTRNTKAENLNSSKGYFYPISVKCAGLSWLLQLWAACTSQQGFKWAPSHGLPSFVALWTIWYSSICSVLTFRFEVQSRKKRTWGSGCASWTSTVLLLSWIFLQLFSLLLSSTSPTLPLLPGLSLPWQLLSQTAKKEPVLQTVVYLAHCDFSKFFPGKN